MENTCEVDIDNLGPEKRAQLVGDIFKWLELRLIPCMRWDEVTKPGRPMSGTRAPLLVRLRNAGEELGDAIMFARVLLRRQDDLTQYDGEEWRHAADEIAELNKFIASRI